ncbi:hypothetical protein [Acrocarpospora catenulata]|uniref:hypothetical protein n=1 Tax=Acrocarpospora catenulata TaxID=2836182 RepID=UPI001BDA6CD8|nr:hypothetical protein [Acrocarpospora catenulata]
MDLSRYRGFFLYSVVVDAGPSTNTAKITLTSGAEDVVLVELSHVVQMAMDGPVEGDDLVDEIIVCELPKTGPWPADAHHLLHHHNNEADLLWLKIIGPREIGVVARTIKVGPTSTRT